MSRGAWFALVLFLLLLVGRGGAMGRQLLAPLPGEGGRLLVAACVDSIPAARDGGWQFDAQVRFPQHPRWTSRRLRLQLAAGVPAPLPGACWQYAAKLSQPHSLRGRRTLLRDHFSGYARVDAGPLDQALAPPGPGLLWLRGRLARRIADQVDDPSAAALLAALAVGATGDLSPRQWQVFNATGITHLVAISGLHVTFFAMLAMAAARRLWQRLAPRRALPRRSLFAAIVGIVLALGYALLAGFSVPAQRTVLMLAAFLGARECARRTPDWWSVAVALAAVLALDPMAVLDAGFWLSFTAVAVIVLVHGARLGQPGRLAEAITLQWVVGIALLPATVAIFGSFSAAGLLVNLAAIPLFSLLLVPPVLVATACYLLPGGAAGWCGDQLIGIAGWVATRMWPLLSWCAELPGALWHATPPWCWYLLAATLVPLALLPLAARHRAAALALLASVFVLRAPHPREGELWLDVRGSASSRAIMLRTRSHLLLLGTGEVHGSGGDVFARQLLPLLRAAGYPVIDMWLPGSLTRDAQAALRVAAAQLPVREVLLAPRTQVPPEMQRCASMQWQWDGIEFQVRASDDGRSCVLAAASGAHRVLPAELAARGIGSGGGEGLRFDERGVARRSAWLRL